MKVRHFPIITICMALTACGGNSHEASGGPTGNAALSPAAPWSRSDIMAAVYDDDYAAPAGFLVDERAGTIESYSLYHVKDASISYEICSNNFEEARVLEEADNSSRAVNGYFVDSYENDLYFEFVRELNYPDGLGNVGGETSPGFARIFKCAAVDRTGVDRNLRSGFAGQLNARPLTGALLSRLTEYLWQFVYFEASSSKVLASRRAETATTFEHTLLLAFAFNQGTGKCDRIEVVDWIFRANKQSGEMSKQFLLRSTFDARRVNGLPEEC